MPHYMFVQLTLLGLLLLNTTHLHERLQLLQSAVVVERQVIGWFSVKHPDPDCCTPSGKFPVFLLQDETDYWYGFPQFGYNGLKIGKFHRGNNIVAHPKDLDRTVSLDDEQVGIRAYLKFACKATLCLVNCVTAKVHDYSQARKQVG